MAKEGKSKISSLGEAILQMLGQQQVQAAQQNAMLQALSGTPSVNAIHAQNAAKDWHYGAGLMIRRILDGLASNWANNYNERGKMKDARQKELTDMFNQKYGDQAGAAIQDLKDQGIWDRWNKLSQFDPNSYNMPSSEPSLGAQHAARQAADKVAPVPGMQEQAQPWENVADKVLPAQGLLGGSDSQLGKQAIEQYPFAKEDDWVYRMLNMTGGLR